MCGRLCDSFEANVRNIREKEQRMPDFNRVCGDKSHSSGRIFQEQTPGPGDMRRKPETRTAANRHPQRGSTLLPRTLCQTPLRPRTSFCEGALRRPQRLVQEGLIDRTSSATPRQQRLVQEGLIDRASSGRPARYRSAESGSTASARRSSSVSGIFAMRHRPTSQGSVTYIDSLLRFLS